LKSYQLGAKDVSPILKEFKSAGVDCFVGLTYPPDNILMTTQAKETDYNPPIYYTAVGTAFPFFRDRFKGAEGVMGIAGWNPKVKTPGAREYFDAHVKKFPEGARSLGQCLRRRIAPDSGAMRRRSGPRPEAGEGDARRHGVHHDRRTGQVREGCQHGHARHGGPVAEGRVRDRVAAELADGGGHRAEAGVGVSSATGA
jgi:hypothetical protein